MDIKNVEKIHIVTERKDFDEFGLTKVDQETIDQLSDFLTQYRVKLTNKEGWISDHEQEQFEIYLGYKNGEMEKYTFERDVVVSSHIYEVMNAPLDYKWIQKFAHDNNFK